MTEAEFWKEYDALPAQGYILDRDFPRNRVRLRRRAGGRCWCPILAVWVSRPDSHPAHNSNQDVCWIIGGHLRLDVQFGTHLIEAADNSDASMANRPRHIQDMRRRLVLPFISEAPA